MANVMLWLIDSYAEQNLGTKLGNWRSGKTACHSNLDIPSCPHSVFVIAWPALVDSYLVPCNENDLNKKIQ
jgi:hypothetical protein